MQSINEELRGVLSERLKLGEYARPVCRVEVDRMTFIPGRRQEVSFVTYEADKKVEIVKTVITDPDTTSSTVNYKNVVNPWKAAGAFSESQVTSPFGQRALTSSFHKGVDLGAGMGQEVVAAWGGTVVTASMVNPYTSWGFYVDIDHGDNVLTRYGHLKQTLVKVGDKVAQGELIALSGNTGNVYSGGKKVSGSYDDPNSDRSKGKGAHLHFEVLINGSQKDPLPYLTGESQLFAAVETTGPAKVESEAVVGTVGTELSRVSFMDSRWYLDDNKKYKIIRVSAELQKDGIVKFLSKPSKNYYLTVQNYHEPNSGKPPAPRREAFAFEVMSDKMCTMDISFFANAPDGAELNVIANDTVVFHLTKFKGNMTEEMAKNIAFSPKADGRNIIEVEYLWKDVKDTLFGISYVSVHEINEEPNKPKKDLANPSESESEAEVLYQERTVESLVFNEVTKSDYLEVGQFVFTETLVLDNVISIDLDDQYEMESREATITVSNLDGYYSPDYNPFYFPEMYRESPWSTNVNGFQMGVLSENTPIRIYLGYGQNVIRVFTGLIDKVDGTAEEHQLTITARDMYKKVLNHVLLSDKAYPKVDITQTIVEADALVSTPSVAEAESKDKDPKVTDAATALPASFSGSRFEEIVAKAKFYAKHKKFNGAPLDYHMLVAISIGETEMGTTGMGQEHKGSYILGYGVTDTKVLTTYAGIDKQLYFGAKRIYDALKSRKWVIDSQDDVMYLYRGGDKGPSYTYASDTNWPYKMWRLYQQIKANPAKYDAVPAYTGKFYTPSPSPSGNIGAGPEASKAGWMKSAVITDLIVTAGMTGWRQAPSDQGLVDYMIEESYLISAKQETGKAIRAVPDQEGMFEEVDIESVETPNGYRNPYMEEYGKQFLAFETKAGDAVSELIKDTNYRSYCDRYGTYRLEQINYNKPIVATFTSDENLVSLTKSTDWSRGRSHLVVIDSKNQFKHFVDTEILMELKGEVRTAVINAPYAQSKWTKRQVAEKFFFDIKRLCRTLQISVPGNPALDVLDRVYVVDRNTTTRSVYTIKGIKTSFSESAGYIQVLDLMWSNGEGAIL
ncbi:M23 family metallopeptidase [Paenibacillus xylanexedens]|uniref:M23 family metallopeptidase n=1 Tax=Paenibacillus xylanexedens TaxID=528191 RepID=UPI0011A3AFD2|nr:M23 family metallopeptidase [Paenibacillus xylanexedens]